ncbi:MAG: copper-binding protein [Betaproteobacteria bacterium]
MKYGATAVLLFALAYPFASLADSSHPPQSASQAELSDGEVRKVDKDAKKITIRHGPLKNLDMPPMTMVFQVKDAAMLEQVKAGDKVRFSAEKTGGAYIVTTIHPAR